MLLQDRMKETKFSPSEKDVVDFLLKKQTELEPYSTTMIAQETFTSPSVLVRIAKKLGFAGFTDFKKAFLEEAVYLNIEQKAGDPNRPIEKDMTYMQTASAIMHTEESSLNETLELMDEALLQRAARAMKKARQIHVFAVSNICFAAEELVFKLRHIGLNAHCYTVSNTMYQEALMAAPEDLAIVISYSGESSAILKVSKLLKSRRIPILAITSLGDNSLSKMANICLRCATREKSYSKIGAFSSLTSIHLVCDILYACVFKTDYDKHMDFKLSVSRNTEVRSLDTRPLI